MWLLSSGNAVGLTVELRCIFYLILKFKSNVWLVVTLLDSADPRDDGTYLASVADLTSRVPTELCI